MLPLVQQNVSLKKYNTFGIDICAENFAEVNKEEELLLLLRQFDFSHTPLLMLGGGSNVLFINDVKGIVIRNKICGIKKVAETENIVRIKVGGGMPWHDVVLWCVEQNLGGIENLSLIPGSMGAAPIQNIGAYGVELQDSFVELEAIEITSGTKKKFSKSECEFGYRNSIFKNKLKGRYIITAVTLELSKHPVLKLSYGAISTELKKMNVNIPNVKDVSDAVIAIRRSKLPDPAIIGNAGSFFKNPEINPEQFAALQKSFPLIVHYPTAENNVKIAAGWLIEQCGWKGKIIGNTGSHKDQALVLVNYGKATGKEILNLANQIMKSVMYKFNIVIEAEVNIIG